LGLIGLLAALSLQLSALPMPVATPLSVLAIAYTFFLIRLELARESFSFVWAGGDADATLNFASRIQSLSGPRLSIRGPLASLQGRDDTGRKQLHLWWPDTLSSAGRRQLRLVDQIRKQPHDPTTTPEIA
jgi:hypothetical protein